MNTLTTTSILNLLDTTKSERQSFVANIIANIEEGYADPIKVKAQVKKIEELTKAIQEHPTFREALATESAKHGKTFELFGAKFEQRAGASKWDFSRCNDDVYANALQKQAALTEQIKKHEEMLKHLPAEGIETITEFGELKRIYPPTKLPAADVIAVSLK
jgi:phage host-nuclease inhibitor protein Gam